MVFCIKPTDETKSRNAGLVRSEECLEDKLLLKEDVCWYLYQSGELHGD